MVVLKSRWFSLVVIVLLTGSDMILAATIQVPQDQPTIQQAIVAARPGDTVIVSPGTYQERIQLKVGVVLKSAGDDAKGKLGLKRAEATIIDGNFEKASGAGVLMAEDSILDGFTVTGVGRFDDARWKKHHATQGEEQVHELIGAPGIAGIDITGTARCTVRNNIVHHIGYTGIAITGRAQTRVSPHIYRNISYRNMGAGIGSMKKSTAIIEGNQCFENFYAGIGHDDASPLVIDNICHTNIRAGIGVSEGACPVLERNKCYRNRRAGIGIRTGQQTSPRVEQNECYENDMAGIGVREEAAPVIRNNRCYKNVMAGIGCRTGARPLIEHNQCYENKMSGIGCRQEAAPVIRNNRCWNNEMAGIGSELNARPVILDNECFSNKMAGIGNEEGAQTIIRGNRCYKNLMAGIGIRKNAKSIIDGNTCYENEMAGIGLEENGQAIVHDNQSYKNKLVGIGMQTGARGLIVANHSRENQQAGIGVREKSSALVIDNTCTENKLVAIGVRNGSNAYLLHNTLVRTGGMPPLVAIREQSSTTMIGNQLRGGGVAGIMVEGTAHIQANQFHGNGPRGGPGPPNFATWVHAKSKVSYVDNRAVGWRHALFAVGAKRVRVIDNQASKFIDTAFVVEKSEVPAHVFGNTALSSNVKDKAIRVEGPQGIVAENRRQEPPAEKLNEKRP